MAGRVFYTQVSEYSPYKCYLRWRNVCADYTSGARFVFLELVMLKAAAAAAVPAGGTGSRLKYPPVKYDGVFSEYRTFVFSSRFYFGHC